jgi:predicted DNA-binding transcriptional regulator AlpA
LARLVKRCHFSGLVGCFLLIPEGNQMRIIRPAVTEVKTGLCDRQLRDLERDGLFPKRFPLNPNGGRAVGHLESEVDEWIAARAATREAANV